MIENDFEKLIERRKKWVDATQENEFEIKDILSGLYDDPSHFVYEILQNAEDVKAKTVCFNLSSDKLEIWHDGKDFIYENVDGITGIGKTTKKGDLNAIGKFGVGFKSVFAVTESPCVFSGQYNFKIQNFVLPEEIPRKYIGSGTWIIIPFNHPTRTSEEIYEKVRHRLNEMGLETLLFLSDIEKIEFKINHNLEGVYNREPQVDADENDKIITPSDDVNFTETDLNKPYRKIKLTYSKGNNILKKETWLVFEKRLNENKSLKSEIAFKLGNDDKGNQIISPTERGKLSVFFLTAIETGLDFIIQGPYRTTPARDNIPFEDEWNRSLVEQTANLVGESLQVIKEMDLLNVDFLKVLPIDKSRINEHLTPIFEKVKEKLNSDDELLPLDNSKYTSAKDALLARGSDLIHLLSDEQLKLIFNRNNWLDGEITKDKAPELREYLMNELDIPEIYPDKFARYLDDNFLKKQSNDWIIEFYKFSHEHPELWKESGILRKKPIIRLEDNRHVLPLKDHAYLPSKDEGISKLKFPFIKKVIASNSESKKFLIDLDFKEPDRIAGILNKILPQYNEEDAISKINNTINLQHVKWIIETLKESPDGERKQNIVEKTKDTAILKCKNIASNEVVCRSPNDGIYLGETYTNNKNIETFFEGNNQIWLLHDSYKDVSIDVDVLKLLGCKTGIETSYIKERWDNHVYLKSNNYKRGLNGFDPDCYIDGLKDALENITLKKAIIIWNILISNGNYKRIRGFIEESSRQDFSSGGRHYDQYEESSRMGKLLTSYAWLPDKNGDYDKPSNLLLTDLPDDFNKDFEAQKIGEILGFRTPAKQKFLGQLPEEERAFHELMSEAYQKGFNEDIAAYIKKLIENPKTVLNRESREDISSTFKNSLSLETKYDTEPLNDPNSSWKGKTHEEEDAIEEKYEKDFSQNLDDKNIKIKYIKVKKSEIDSNSKTHTNGKDFLNEQYEGHCQICNTRLDLGNGKSSFISTHISNRKHEHTWSDEVWNLLCLCPNCHALYKHGRNNDLNNIQEIALLASKNEIVPEPIEERNGDFYIANIKLVGQEKQIYYTPEHLRKTSVIVKIANDNGDT